MYPKSIKLGSKDNEVKLLQVALNGFGFKLEVDGDFGKETDHAVREFQKDLDLTIDGIVGDKTWSALQVDIPEEDDKGAGEPDPSTKPRKSTAPNLLSPVPKGALKGVDVSHWNPVKDFGKLKAEDIAFMMTKCTEGLSSRDKTYQPHMDGARKTGIPCGGYHFFHADFSAEAQANHFVRNLKIKKGDLVPQLDFEDHGKQSAGSQVHSAMTFLTIVMAHLESLGITKLPLVYLSRSFMNDIGNPQEFFKFPNWIAEYNKSCHLPPPWNKVNFWQHSDKGKVAGVTNPCDVNWFFGDKEALQNHIV